MDEELRCWAKTWKSMEVKDMKLVSQAQSAHRHEAISHSVSLIALLVAALGAGWLVVEAIASAQLHARWPGLVIGVTAVILVLEFMRRWGRQIAEARAALTDTPAGMLRDLVRLYERRLWWWVGKWPLRVTIVMAVVGLVYSANFVRIANVAAVQRVAWGAFAFQSLSLLVFLGVGLVRVRHLRRELSRLRELQSQLAGDDT